MPMDIRSCYPFVAHVVEAGLHVSLLVLLAYPVLLRNSRLGWMKTGETGSEGTRNSYSKYTHMLVAVPCCLKPIIPHTHTVDSTNVVTGSSLRLAGHARTISEEPVTTFVKSTVPQQQAARSKVRLH
ncbi:hypothetical protein CROQUDRAFT_656356 [Cronartium quercuum f. sp. fusiforme G11]|uniref:Uncharacterized protein n=1 Tax=Cronartium quercuum f. sp. fusiforme G11 TaxID=708437 RepID=A0A9P6TD22_9BASI|nr:hypothetical protein CROQUDRAFT_656356 [Cronartium quercuum f. sp. fusiforme G11]